MLGAIIGDLTGSIYEYDEYNKKNIERTCEVLTKDNLIEKDSFYTDDTVLTMAILDAILEEKDYVDSLKQYALKYKDYIPNTKANHFENLFSPNFIKWCQGNEEKSSFGNGALMRVSPIGYLYNSFDEVINETKKATMPSHNSSLALSSAEVLNAIIYKFRQGTNFDKMKIIFCPSSTPIDKMRLTNEFDSSCLVFEKCKNVLFQSNSFEDALRKAVSLGGATGTIGAITGSMAEAYYGIPDHLKEQALAKLPNEFIDKLNKGYAKIKKLN